MQYIQLTKGKFALVDDEDFEWLCGYEWLAFESPTNRTVYAARWMFDEDGKRIFCLMHRIIIGALPGEQVDHVDRNGLNNQRYNLRRCSNAENQYNRATPSNNTSGYKGVSLFKPTGQYRASIQHEGKRYHLGYFDTAEEAARAYDACALELHPEFARLNFLIGSKE